MIDMYQHSMILPQSSTRMLLPARGLPVVTQKVIQLLHLSTEALRFVENHRTTIGKPWENHGKMVV